MSRRRKRSTSTKKGIKPFYPYVPTLAPLDDDEVSPPVLVHTSYSPGYFGDEPSDVESEPQG